MNIYKEAEKELAELLGWTNIKDEKYVSPSHSGTLNGLFGFIPEWCSDDAAAFKLMVEHSIAIYIDDHPEGCSCVEAEFYYPTRGQFIVNLDDHVNKSMATRYAIVQSIVTKLKASK